MNGEVTHVPVDTITGRVYDAVTMGSPGAGGPGCPLV